MTSDKTLHHLGIAFLFLLIVRSVSDAFLQTPIYISSVKFSFSVGLGFSIIIIGVAYVIILFLSNSLTFDKVGWIFLGWVASLSPWVYLAASNFGSDGLLGVKEWIRLWYLVIVYLVIFSMVRRIGYNKIVNIILLALPVPLGWAYYQFIFDKGKGALFSSRISGPMIHPNVLATFLVLMIALTVWKISQQRGPRKFLWSGLLTLELFAFVMPISLNGWLILGVLLMVSLLFTEDNKFKKQLTIGITLFGLLLLVIVLTVGGVRTEFLQIFQMGNYKQVDHPGASQNSIKWRVETWKQLLNKWQARPLSGYGLNTSIYINPVTGKAPHNDYLRYLVECGIPGLIIFVLFQISVGWNFSQHRKTIPKDQQNLRNLFWICMGLYAGWVVGGFGDNIISQTTFQIYLWALIATVASAARNRELLENE